ncbi:MAG: hypothetical protein H7837_04810 [Magnetococcus sp. MYC-9]
MHGAGGLAARPSASGWRVVLLLVPLLFCSCLSLLHNRTERALALAEAHGLSSVTLEQNGFSLLTLLRAPPVPHRLLVVYVEGDGVAWLDRYHLSPDPTPREPLVLEMMLQDPHPAVAYLGRPCQYLERAVSGCANRYWSTHRYAPEVVAALGGAIDRLKQRLHSEEVGLVGYSGGGALAALLAAERRDVAWLITVAANLDLTAWLRHHQLSPMPASRNPADFAERLARLPQYHFVGEEDERVPAGVVRAYADRLLAPTALTVRAVPRADHACCWAAQWPALLAQVPFRERERPLY